MAKKILSLVLLLFKVFLLYKGLEWIYYRINFPNLHPITEIDWILVMIIIDTWLVSQTKIEITGILQKRDD